MHRSALALTLLLCAVARGTVASTTITAAAGTAHDGSARDVAAPGLASADATACDCQTLQADAQRCHAAQDDCTTELTACRRERDAKDQSVRNLIADRAKRDASDAEWRSHMRARADACAPRDEPERVWVAAQQRCLEDKFECQRERNDRELALRNCLHARDTGAPVAFDPLAAAANAPDAATVKQQVKQQVVNAPVSATGVAAGDSALAAIGAMDMAVGTVNGQVPVPTGDGGAAAAPAFVWPRVSVLCPVCVKRHRWLPNLYAMFAHQTYAGPIELVLLDGRCSKMPEVAGVDSAFMRDVMARDARVRYHFDDRPDPLVIGAKRNWLVANATGEVMVTFDVDDYYGPQYVSRMVWLLMSSGPDVGMVKLHAWFSLGEGWLVDPTPRRYKAWTYIDMEHDPLGWGWTYVFWRRTHADHPLIRYGEVDASEEAGLFHSLRNNGFRIATYADRWFLCLRIVTYSIVRTTGAGPCQANARGCTNLPDFMVLHGFGGADKLKPWLDLWDARD